ncbi:hypothetical protein [Glutamicibacter sp. JC586]|uniref:hypothetical protein n=1 Tax=Glutamicibacter sp. JC586 TaxID=2590552 RepID=UPI00190F5CF7|nr:hypothetical protein [Glutamicibacter sp. JC586]
MNYPSAPANLTALKQRIKNLEGEDLLIARRQTSMALVIVGQLLPEEPSKVAVPWRFAMALRHDSPATSMRHARVG